jgi:hypothetical protein
MFVDVYKLCVYSISLQVFTAVDIPSCSQIIFIDILGEPDASVLMFHKEDTESRVLRIVDNHLQTT